MAPQTSPKARGQGFWRKVMLLLLGLQGVGIGLGLGWAGIYALAQSASPAPETPPPLPSPAGEATPSATPLRPLSPTATWIPSATPTVTATPTPTPSPTLTPTPSLTPTPALPTSALIRGIGGHMPLYNLSCEAAAAVEWAAFFGVKISEVEFQRRLPRSDNPNKGFVGNPGGVWGQIPPRDYGVHAGPVAALLRDYGLPARAVTGLGWEGLRAQIAAGHPVIAWVVGDLWAGTPVRYRSQDGEEVTVVPYEHTVLVVGYTEDTVTVVNRDLWLRVPRWVFLRSWQALGEMAVIWGEE